MCSGQAVTEQNKRGAGTLEAAAERCGPGERQADKISGEHENREKRREEEKRDKHEDWPCTGKRSDASSTQTT